MKRLLTMAVAVMLFAMLAPRAVAAPVGIFDGSQDIGDPPTDPSVAGSATEAAGVYTVQASGSDWWSAGEYGHLVYKQVSGDWRIEANLDSIADDGDGMNDWTKWGVAARNDLDIGGADAKSVNYFMAAVKPGRNFGSFQGRNTDTENMFNDNRNGPNDPVRVALQSNMLPTSHGPKAFVEGFVDFGTGWEEVGQRWAVNLAASPYVGLAATSHDNGKTDTSTFSNVQFVAPTAPTDVPFLYFSGDPIADPEGVAPVMGGWGALEVVDNGRLNSVGDAVRSLSDGGGTRVPYQLMGPINYNDHEGDARRFPGDRGWQVVYDGIKAPGAVDDMAYLARGQIDIPTAGDWTFHINGDDGTELMIDNGALIIGGEGWNDNYFGTINLSAGVHDIRVVFRERGGGNNLEVAAAIGNTTDLSRFRLIGSGDPGLPTRFSTVPAIANVNLEQTPAGWGTLIVGKTKPESRDTALVAIEEARTDGVLLTGVDTVINHSDADDGGGLNRGSFGGDHNYLNDAPGVDENDHAFKAMFDLVITQEDDYFLGFNSDDGSALQIAGQTWTGVAPGSHGNAVIDGDWLKTDAWTGWAYSVGEIHLTPGTYAATYISYEGGGGAFSEVFGGTELDGLALLGDTEQVIVIQVADALELVPEPSTLLMLLCGGAMGLAGLLRRRRNG